jgi:hypothetical protein
MPFWFEDKGLCEDALDMIAEEDVSQIEKWGNQKHHIHKWMIILGEEYGELCLAVLGCQLKDIIREATHVATVALKIAWMARRKFED